MLVVYDNLFELKPEEPYGEKTRLTACAHSKVLVTLDTREFQVLYKDGAAEVHLSRHLTNQQARDFANAILKRVEQLEEQEKAWNAVMGTTVTPEGSVVNVVMNVPNQVGHGG